MYAVDRWGPFAERIGSSAAEAGQASLAFLCRQLSKLGGMEAMCRERLVPLQYVHNILNIGLYILPSSFLSRLVPLQYVHNILLLKVYVYEWWHAGSLQRPSFLAAALR